MIQRSATYGSKILREFRNLDGDNHHAIVHFFEENEREISRMNLDDFFILQASYENALFEIGAFQKMLPVTDQVVEHSIIYNVQFFQGEDIYLKGLYHKAYALARLHDYPAAQGVLEELIRIRPNFKPYKRLLRKCMLRQRPLYVKRLFAIGVILYLVSVAMVVLNILFIEPFHSDFLSRAEYIRFAIFVLGIISLLSGEITHHVKTRRRINKITSRKAAIRSERKVLVEEEIMP